MRSLIPILALLALIGGWYLLRDDPPAAAVPPPGGRAADANVAGPDSAPAEPANPLADALDSDPVVHFPGGSRYEISLRPLPDPPLNKQESISGYIHDLKISALSGDGTAAFQLYYQLSSCKNAYRDAAELESAIQRMYETRIYPPDALGGSDTSLRVDDVWSLEAAEQELRESAGNCAALDAADIASAGDWLRLGAELDDAPSLVTYATREGPDSGQDQSAVQSLADEAALRRAWMQGSVTALERLSVLYRDGSSNTAPDAVMAYASRYLFDRLLQVQLDNIADRPAGFPSQAFVAENRDTLNEMMLSLRPSEVDTAIAIAEDMLRGNPKCCFDSF
ncbi:MAG: hypothetical protein KJO31_15205 [Gammaproteobacteria bacterium]|nr:hypothetical protein [Gammaproteobacteria bacterium]